MLGDEVLEGVFARAHSYLREYANFVANAVGVDDLGEKELAKLAALCKERVFGQGRSERGHVRVIADGNSCCLFLIIRFERGNSTNNMGRSFKRIFLS